MVWGWARLATRSRSSTGTGGRSKSPVKQTRWREYAGVGGRSALARRPLPSASFFKTRFQFRGPGAAGLPIYIARPVAEKCSEWPARSATGVLLWLCTRTTFATWAFGRPAGRVASAPGVSQLRWLRKSCRAGAACPDRTIPTRRRRSMRGELRTYASLLRVYWAMLERSGSTATRAFDEGIQ